MINHPTPKPTHPTMTKSSTENPQIPKTFNSDDATAHFQLYFPLARHLSPRAQLSIQIRYKCGTNTFLMQHKYTNTILPTSPLSCSPYDCPFSRNYPESESFLPKNYPQTRFLRPTCDPYLWRPLYLKLWCQIQIHLQYSQKILENHSAIQLSSSSNHFWTASDISCKQVLKIHVHHIPKLRGPNLCNGVNIVTYITK